MSNALLALVILMAMNVMSSAGNAFTCYKRAGTIKTELGTVTDCGAGVKSCYAYTSNDLHYADCGNGPEKLAVPLLKCDTEKCNKEKLISPTVRGCVEQTADSIVSKEITCPNIADKCYSYKSEAAKQIAGCGDCKPEYPKPCFSCTGDNCNKDIQIHQVKRKCYERSGTTAAEIGSSKPCLIDNKPETHCYSYSYETKQFAGCGKCPAGTKSAFKCEDCEKDDCNKEIVKSVICYKLPEETDRSQIYNPSKKSNVLCRSQDKCHHYTNADKKKVADCGPCPAGVSDCKDCTSDYCNGNSKLVATGSATIIGILMLAVMKLGF